MYAVKAPACPEKPKNATIKICVQTILAIPVLENVSTPTIPLLAPMEMHAPYTMSAATEFVPLVVRKTATITTRVQMILVTEIPENADTGTMQLLAVMKTRVLWATFVLPVTVCQVPEQIAAMVTSVPMITVTLLPESAILRQTACRVPQTTLVLLAMSAKTEFVPPVTTERAMIMIIVPLIIVILRMVANTNQCAPNLPSLIGQQQHPTVILPVISPGSLRLFHLSLHGPLLPGGPQPISVRIWDLALQALFQMLCTILIPLQFPSPILN